MNTYNTIKKIGNLEIVKVENATEDQSAICVMEGSYTHFHVSFYSNDLPEKFRGRLVSEEEATKKCEEFAKAA